MIGVVGQEVKAAMSEGGVSTRSVQVFTLLEYKISQLEQDLKKRKILFIFLFVYRREMFYIRCLSNLQKPICEISPTLYKVMALLPKTIKHKATRTFDVGHFT